MVFKDLAVGQLFEFAEDLKRYETEGPWKKVNKVSYEHRDGGYNRKKIRSIYTHVVAISSDETDQNPAGLPA